MKAQKIGSWLLFTGLALIWGSSFILMKRAAQELTGWQIGAVRISAAALILAPAGIFHIWKVPVRKLPLIVLSGMLGNLFPAFLFATALEYHMDSSLASILNSLTPLFVIAVGTLVFRMKVNTQKTIGVLLGFFGLVILTVSRSSISFTGLAPTVLILIATAMYGFNVNIVGRFLQGIEPLKIATVSMTIIGIPAFVLMWQQNIFPIFENDAAGRSAILQVALLGIVGTAIATILFYMLIQKSGTLFASLVTYAIPIVGIGWGFLDGENITALQVVCLGVILAGVFLANKKPKSV